MLKSAVREKAEKFFTNTCFFPTPVQWLAEDPPDPMLTGESPLVFLGCLCMSAGLSLSGVRKFSIQG